MQRQTLMVLTVALAFRAATGFAQDGALAGVTMRVVDDVSALDAVILELDADSGEGEKAAEPNVREADAASVDEADAATERRDAAAQEEGNVERPALPPTPVP
jgi:hypothetical protein